MITEQNKVLDDFFRSTEGTTYLVHGDEFIVVFLMSSIMLGNMGNMDLVTKMMISISLAQVKIASRIQMDC
jgi:hypothetical protein